MSINATLIAQMITFGILIWFTMKFIWPPLTKAIDDRAQRISEGLSAAERAREELADADARVVVEIKKARIDALVIVDKANQQATQIVERAKQDALAEAARQKTVAAAEIDSMAHRAREALRAQVGALAIVGAERILRREIDASTHKILIDELVAEL